MKDRCKSKVSVCGKDRLTRSVHSGTLLALVIILVGTSLRVPILFRSLYEPMLYGFRQTQTAMMAREYGRDLAAGWSPLPIFGPDSQVPMEFPIFQWCVGLLVHLTGMDVGIATRALSLLCFQVSTLLIFLLAKRFFGTLVALVSVLLMQFTPFSILWSAAALIESCAVALVLAAILAMIRFADTLQWRYQAISIFFMGLAFLTKPTTAILWVPVALVASLSVRKPGSRLGVQTWNAALPAMVGLILTFIWTHFADSIKATSGYTEFLTSSNLTAWNFGSVTQRLELENWASIFDRSPWSGMSWLILLVPIVALLTTKRHRMITLALALLFPLGVFIFFNLYWVHIYYAMAIFPSLCVLAGIAVVGVVSVFDRGRWRVGLSGLMTGAILIGLWISPDGINTEDRLTEKFPLPVTVQLIKENSTEDAQILLFGCDWDPTTLFIAERSGLMVRDIQESRKVSDGELSGRKFFATSCGSVLTHDQILEQLPDGRSLEEVAPGLYRVMGFASKR